MKRIQFYVTEQEYKILEIEAQSRGETVASLSKRLFFREVAKSPCKGIFKHFSIQGQLLNYNAFKVPCTPQT